MGATRGLVRTGVKSTPRSDVALKKGVPLIEHASKGAGIAKSPAAGNLLRRIYFPDGICSNMYMFLEGFGAVRAPTP